MRLLEELTWILIVTVRFIFNFILYGKLFAKINRLMQPITHFQGFWLFRWYLNNLLFFLIIAGLIGLVALLIEDYKENKSKES